MAFAYIEEYEHLATDSQGNVTSTGQQPPLTTQRVTFTTTTQSTAFNKRTRFIRVVVDTNAHYLIGVNPTAVNTNGSYLPAGSAEYFGLHETLVSNGDLEIAFVTT